MKKIALFLLMAVLFGCAGAPVGFGGTDEVVFADKDTIKIQWDNLTTNEDKVRKRAIDHCAKTNRGVQIVDATSDPATFGLIRSRTWKCTELQSSTADSTK